MQTTLLGSSNSATVEFVIPEDGSYIMVDHHFANASRGAMGLISTAARVDGTEIEHHKLPASATPTELEAAQGKLNFESKCVACHSIGQGRRPGPDMVGVTKRRTEDWLTRWLRAPDRMLESDPDARRCSRSTTTSRCPTRISPARRSGNTSSTSNGSTLSRQVLCPRAEPATDAASHRDSHVAKMRVAEMGRRASVSRPISHLRGVCAGLAELAGARERD
jgi:hypothetical protein